MSVVYHSLLWDSNFISFQMLLFERLLVPIFSVIATCKTAIIKLFTL